MSKKNYYFSNLIINKYILRDPEVGKLKDMILPYYNNHKKNFDNFTVCNMWKKNGVLIEKISVPRIITLEKRYMGMSNIIGIPIVEKVTLVDYLDTFYSFMNSVVDEMNIIFLSDLKDITFFHYKDQPKSMVCRRLIR